MCVNVVVTCNTEYDITCFGLDANDKLSDDRYMVFYNQTASPNNEIVMQANGRFMVDLNRLPVTINKLVFTVNVDADSTSTMGNVTALNFDCGEYALALNGSNFSSEKAVIVSEIYRRNGQWKINMVARGFNGGLSALLANFGGEEDTSTSNTNNMNNQNVGMGNVGSQSMNTNMSVSAPVKVSLEKKLEKEAPKLVSLAKPIKVCLDKHKLNTVMAKVALVMDLSGSMNKRYRNGVVQRIVDKTIPLAVQFDDDGSMEFWYFGDKPVKMDDVTLQNYETVTNDWMKIQRKTGACNDEPKVMRQVIDTFKDSDLPVYVLFVSDGGIHETKKIAKLMAEASSYPIFWQFMGVGGYDYGVLEKLDSMPGRVVDNANFFAIDDFDIVSNEELYDRLLCELPSWLDNAKRVGVLK